MNPVTYAQALVKRQGFDKALEIAEGNLNIMKQSQGLATPLADEVDITEHTVVDKETGKVSTKTITIIDEVKKAKRLAKGQTFWTNVTSYLRKRNPANKAA